MSYGLRGRRSRDDLLGLAACRTSAPGRPSALTFSRMVRAARASASTSRAWRGAAGERLQADGAGAGVQVQRPARPARRPRSGLPGGEQALARPVGGGAGAGARRHGQPASAGRAGDHAGHRGGPSSSCGGSARGRAGFAGRRIEDRTAGAGCSAPVPLPTPARPVSPCPGTARAPRPAARPGPYAAPGSRSSSGSAATTAAASSRRPRR